jgi:hypothetical protein
VPGPCDIALLSLGTTPGLRRADAAFKAAADTAGVSCEVVSVRIGAAGKLRRQITLTDLVEARAARRTDVDARVVVYSTVTAALLQRPSVPYAIRFDAPAALNRPGIAGAWQRAAERRAMAGAVALLPWGSAAAEAVHVATKVIPLHVPIEAGGYASAAPIETVASAGPTSTEPRASADARDIDALAYAGYPEKRGLDILVEAWTQSASSEQMLLIAGIDRQRGEEWLGGRGTSVPGNVEWLGLLDRTAWLERLRRARLFVNASRREDHGLSQLEALASGAMLVTVPSAGPYEALPIAHRLDERLVANAIEGDALARALRAGLAAESGDYAERAARELEPYSADAVQRVFEQQVLPALGLR